VIAAVALRDAGPFEDAYLELRRWIDSAQAGEMNGDEMLSRAGDIAEHLDDAIVALRRALGW
jgi:hypothetical protein